MAINRGSIRRYPPARANAGGVSEEAINQVQTEISELQTEINTISADSDSIRESIETLSGRVNIPMLVNTTVNIGGRVFYSVPNLTGETIREYSWILVCVKDNLNGVGYTIFHTTQWIALTAAAELTLPADNTYITGGIISNSATTQPILFGRRNNDDENMLVMLSSGIGNHEIWVYGRD